MNKFFTKRKAKLTLRKLTIGLVSLGVGCLLMGNANYESGLLGSYVYADGISDTVASRSPSAPHSVNLYSDSIDPDSLITVRDGYYAKFTYITIRNSVGPTRYAMSYAEAKEKKYIGNADFSFEIYDANTNELHIKSDGQRDIVHVVVQFTYEESKPSNEKYEPTGGEITVEEGTPVSDEEITGKVTIPEGSNGTPSIIGERPKTNTPGDYPVEVEVTYPDGSKDTTTVTVHVTPKPSNEKYEPTGGEITVEEGTPVSDEEITGKVTIPEGSNGTPSIIGERPKTNTPGDYPVEVEVTYPDGSKDTTTVTVHVTPKPSTSNRESKKGLTKELPKTGMYGEYDKLGFGFMGLYAALVLIKFNLKRKEDEELM